MPFVIGTAGHIDHGKSSLVKALTGQDPDRLKEEKERGISIELGFAYLDRADGTRVGVVDVPGHERFIRTMLAGAHGIDLVLFTVAADDGVMPQTEEHFDIVLLLGITRAIFVITKADLVTESRVSEVEDEIGLLIAGTCLEGSPMMSCSVVTGRGLEDVRAQIDRTLATVSEDELHVGVRRGAFRLPVDRVFLMPGHGLVVTGTALSGTVRAGDQVRALPRDQLFRVRSVQVHNENVTDAQWGQRVALNLTGHEKPSIERGDVICDEQITMTTDRFDARIEVRTTAKRGVRNHQRVRVHLGTAERIGTLILLGPSERLEAKQRGFCQLVLTERLVAMRGDRFVIRDETAQRTLGGGVVIHPLARRHKRNEAGLLERLEQLHGGSLADGLGQLLAASDGFASAVQPFHQILNVPADVVRATLAQMPGVESFAVDGELFYSTTEKWRGVKEQVLRMLAKFHAAQPLSPGMEMEAARDGLDVEIAPRLFRAAVERMETEASIAREGSLMRLPSHTVQLREDDRTLADRVAALLGREPFAPPDLKQIEREVGVSRSRLGEILRFMERERSVVRVSTDLYFAIGTIERMRAALQQHLSGTGEITPATFRDLFGTTRKYAIPLLEYLDREGVTIRVGDTRRLRR